jgi:hypothetical protein
MYEVQTLQTKRAFSRRVEQEQERLIGDLSDQLNQNKEGPPNELHLI